MLEIPAAILLWLGAHTLVTTLMFTMVMDLATGLTASARERRINSKLATDGWIMKAAVLLAVCFAFGIEPFISSQLGKIAIGEMVTAGFIVTESISIIENLGRSGVKMPGWFRQVFTKLANEVVKNPPD